MDALIKVYVRREIAQAMARDSLAVKKIFDDILVDGLEITGYTLLVLEPFLSTAPAVIEFGTSSAHSFSGRTQVALEKCWKAIVDLLDDEALLKPDIRIYTTLDSRLN